MMRDKWQFGFPARQVREAAARLEKYHAARVDFWRNEEEKVKAEVKESGLVIEEFPVTGGYRADVQIKPELVQRFQECVQKRKEHSRRQEEFEDWMLALAATNQDQHLQLNQDDVTYFELRSKGVA